MKKFYFCIALVIFSAFFRSSVWAGQQTDDFITASLAVDTSAASPQYLSGIDLSPLNSIDDSTLTTSLLPASIDTSSPSFVFKFTTGYTPPSDEEIKSVNLKLVYKTNVGTLSQHYVVVKYLNSSGARNTCVSQHTLPVPSTSGIYATEEFDISSCHDGSSITTLEVYYFASALLQPVNTSFDYIAEKVTHGNKTSGGSSPSTTTETKSSFIKNIDVSKTGGTILKENGLLKIIFGFGSLPYETKIETEKVIDPQIVKPANLVGGIYKLSVFASFNGYPLPSFNPSLFFMTYPSCSGRPVIQMSTDGKVWKSLFTVRAYNPLNTVAAVIKSPGYFSVSCN